jgi:hypothetical protein
LYIANKINPNTTKEQSKKIKKPIVNIFFPPIITRLFSLPFSSYMRKLLAASLLFVKLLLCQLFHLIEITKERLANRQ